MIFGIYLLVKKFYNNFMDNLAKLQEVCGIGTSRLRQEYKAASGLRLNIITAGRYGSGVSEVIGRVNGYFNELGLCSGWENIIAGDEFFALSKKITNALCFSYESVSDAELKRFACLSQEMDFDTCSYDVLYLNDHPGLIAAEYSPAKKIYRCHFDISGANQKVWEFFKPYIESCDAIIFTHPSFHKELKGNIFYIPPSIDPCTVKNTFVPREEALKVLKEFKIPADKPIITQVGRFDKTKDPFGVIDAFRVVRAQMPCSLVLAGGHAREDTDSLSSFEALQKYAAGEADIFILAIDKQDYKIAALQSISDVIVQKSLSESFGLAITEALWKARPVVASDVGGIPLQIKHDKTGLLCRDAKTCAAALLEILQNTALSRRLGKNGHEYVREHFLINSELEKHLDIFKRLT
jgi:trehalose synthase